MNESECSIKNTVKQKKKMRMTRTKNTLVEKKTWNDNVKKNY